jgi:hypothetical protein
VCVDAIHVGMSVTYMSASPAPNAVRKRIGAVTRHLAEATYWMLNKQEPYRESMAYRVWARRRRRKRELESLRGKPVAGLCTEHHISQAQYDQ